MKTSIIAAALVSVLLAVPSRTAAHCQVPCGVYGDQLRFESMLEDYRTIAKAMKNVNDLAGKTDGQSANQLVRWVTTKDDHATKTQRVIADYFMAQRIKSSDEAGYAKKLAAAHAVMVAAMKCKQNADPKVAEDFKKAIFDFYRAYEGKEPKFETE